MNDLAYAIAAIPPGRYVAAVSGGVDSMVLLDVLAAAPGLECVAAHIDHGIRADSAEDYDLVKQASRRYGCVFYGARVALGPDAGEAAAREVRYGFLRSVMRRTGAQGIVTAHHQDDLVETMALQITRGTGRRGLTPLSAQNIVRPFLQVNKSVLTSYAVSNGVVWHEDSTNANPAYARNRLRLGPLSSRSPTSQTARGQLLDVHSAMAARNQAIDRGLEALDEWLLESDSIVRWKFAQLPHVVARDYLAYYLRGRSVEFDARYLERVTVALKVQKPYSRISAGVGRFVEIGPKTAKLLVQ